MRNKFFKLFALLLVAVLCTLCFAGCQPTGTDGTSSGETETSSAPAKDAEVINVAVIKGPTGVGMASLMEKDANTQTEYDYNFQLLSGPEQTVALLTNKTVDIAAMPTNLAANFNGKGGDVTVLAVNTLGVLYILDSTGEVTDINSLKGKTIYSTGKGSNPEFILNYVLEKNGIDPEEDLTIEYLTDNTELSSKLVSDDIKIAMVPEPLVSTVTAKNKDLKVVMDMTEEWKNAGGSGELMMGCVAVRNEFLENSPNAVADFMKEYEASIAACEDVDAAAALCVKHEIIAAEPIAKNAIPRCNLVFVTGEDMKTKLSGYLSVLYQANPNSIGGQLPDENFYYSGK